MATDDHDHFIGSSSRDDYNSVCLIRFARRQSLRLRVAWRPSSSISFRFLVSNIDSLLFETFSLGIKAKVCRNLFTAISFSTSVFRSSKRFDFFPSLVFSRFFHPSLFFFLFFFLKRVIDCLIKDRAKVYNGKVTVDIQLFLD